MKRITNLLSGCVLAMLLPGTAVAGQCELEITGNDAMQYDTDEMVVDADCDEITVELVHSGDLGVSQMGHNWVLTRTGDFQDTARAGQGAGLENDYLPDDRSAIIAATDMIGGGERTSVTFDGSKVEQGQDYTFFCSFPGHWGQMRGELRVM